MHCRLMAQKDFRCLVETWYLDWRKPAQETAYAFRVITTGSWQFRGREQCVKFIQKGAKWRVKGLYLSLAACFASNLAERGLTESHSPSTIFWWGEGEWGSAIWGMVLQDLDRQCWGHDWYQSTNLRYSLRSRSLSPAPPESNSTFTFQNVYNKG